MRVRSSDGRDRRGELEGVSVAETLSMAGMVSLEQVVGVCDSIIQVEDH